ncbi:MAG TPA: Fe-S cluster assembly ATPase SufC [Candidatus Marinimicrobia bacterium]|jgi:Fe-S cluster assembly ATP-binding protein|nr:Fe-S cluster assembly ATPase SufC [Candidatus Neomarinimicrobiota bacterium]HHZ99422.1 Fe-S cluster assembly ATPase SufC [Candidatus Neomarinimicrobiota bacterium]HIB02622.1 Fe-S cluster assembly ATPase SufC [Candidatus Neomarinimicrobiota bacterium]HIB70033.1 Fe-S cluster assembly ATPase SufC [Candidatus Neomarinimicrobiota bacterium]HIB95099.1 Fe-S cluster assembly ATPase SufC [Candidatus Neomarinimicrobiota bacterium]
MLEIKNLHVAVEDKPILKGIDLVVNTGELHAIMGPNGSGKSTLAHVIAGQKIYEVLDGEILYNGNNLLEMDVEERALEGVFMSYQYPAVIPGVNLAYFMKAAVNAIRKHRGEPEMDAVDFLSFIKEKLAQVKMDESYLKRAVNDGFSGGEKKRNEILQMLVLDPTLAVLDETDSGLDIDAIRIVADGVNKFRREDRAVVVITHYQRILQYMDPDKIHVLMDGRIIRSGGKNLAHELEEKGYGWLEETVVA